MGGHGVFKEMKKNREKEFKTMCRQAAVRGLIPDADGHHWLDVMDAGRKGVEATYRDTMGGYKLGDFDRRRKKELEDGKSES